ncbi:G-type lectin S-receptor-like serine/threonine-protein kinase RKS1 [Prosopis cineraria]|uniref:G-type lectin S-receptor-like serine/threonine-protein kinase RKS1 n=1 Tax=Prosopis cineraria TaxID=364024 RepID=UPI0024102F11|nr:G-type lectin S-receptor-like serine/threonine-protein kinase RKS1 [Prosopis cineraria]
MVKTANRMVFIYVISFYYSFLFCSASDAITIDRPLSDGELLVSKESKFSLGFSTPGKSSSRYVGIWYHNLPKQTVVWVAKRDNPISDTSGVLSLSPSGNLVLHHSSTKNIPIWSTNVSFTVPNTTVMAQLSDTGNLVLIQNDSKVVLWQSFDHPTDTSLPHAKLGFNKKTGQNWFLQSWKTEDADPATGSYSARFNTFGKAQLFLYKENAPLWENDNEIEITYNAVDNTSIFMTVAVPSGF